MRGGEHRVKGMRDEIDDLFHEDELDGEELEDLNAAVTRAEDHEEAAADARRRRLARVPWRDPDVAVPVDEFIKVHHGRPLRRDVSLPR